MVWRRANAAGAALFLILFGGGGVLASGCSQPTADVLAAWINAEPGVTVRQVQLYDGGDRYAVPWSASVSGSSTALLQLGVDGRGRGVALSGVKETVYQSLRDGRMGTFSRYLDPRERDFQTEFVFARNADALLRAFADENAGWTFAFMPLTSRYAMRSVLLESPVARRADSKWLLLPASDAPVLFWVEQSSGPLRVDGVVRAVAYPSEVGQTLAVTEPVVLATGEVHGRGIDDASFPARVSMRDWCRGRTCVSPSGRVLSAMAEEPCALWVWTWAEATSPSTPLEPQWVELPEGCPDTDPHLLAQIDDDVFVLDDDDRVHVMDRGAGTVEAVPKLGDGVVTMLVRDHGRVVLLVTQGGQVVHIDAEGPRLLATEQTICSLRDGLVASPSGNWVVQTCPDEGATEFGSSGSTGSILRVSVLGLERFFGIPMRPLGVDDRGNVLLYSYDDSETQAEPRGLFVLTGDGQLARVDDLEPAPATIALATTSQDRFSAASIQ